MKGEPPKARGSRCRGVPLLLSLNNVICYFVPSPERGTEYCDEYIYIRQVNVVNGGYTVMLAVVLSFCPSVRT